LKILVRGFPRKLPFRFAGAGNLQSCFPTPKVRVESMPVKHIQDGTTFGLLPEPEGRSASFITSVLVNGTILALALIAGILIKPSIVARRFEQTTLILPSTPPPPPKIKVETFKLPEPPKVAEVKLEAPRILVPRPEPEPVRPIQMEAKITMPVLKTAKSAIVLAPQPKSALMAAAAPAQVLQSNPSTAPVHLGQTFGVAPNPNATRPATIAAIGNYGGMNGAVTVPRGVVGSTGLGNGTRSGSNGGTNGGGRVASTGLPAMTVAAPTPRMNSGASAATGLEVLSKPPVQYTSEARQLKVQGEVVLRVVFTASGQVVVENVVRGLGHGLDEEARRVAQQIRFRPATRNGHAVDLTTNIVITFQLA
jgi:TonB family protein